jgi:hypothetical protein
MSDTIKPPSSSLFLTKAFCFRQILLSDKFCFQAIHALRVPNFQRWEQNCHHHAYHHHQQIGSQFTSVKGNKSILHQEILLVLQLNMNFLLLASTVVVVASIDDAKPNFIRRRLMESMSMSAPIFEAEFSMSAPIVEAEMSMPVLGKARKLTSRRLTESMSISLPIYEAEFSMSTPTRFIVPSEFSMSAPIVEAEMSMPVLGKARKLTSRRLTESMSMSAPI